MPTRSINVVAPDPFGVNRVFSKNYATWQNSLRVNGKLSLRANPLTLSRGGISVVSASAAPNGNKYSPLGFSDQCNPSQVPGWDWGPLDNQALARFRGKIRKGSASMGVTLASWKQSRDMIVNRSNHLRKTLDTRYEVLKGNKHALDRLWRDREPTANQVLETEFGWRPLFQDMYAALYTVCQDGIPPEYVKGRARGIISVKTGHPDPLASAGSRTWYGDASSTVASRVNISNPNLWLLNRLGLINPGTVIWDLIPWSFVVNMFLNVNAMINQVTDEIGLSVTDISTTHTSSITMTDVRKDATASRGVYSTTYGGVYKTRTTGSLPAVSWQVKVPDLNWELCLIASSLVVQKIKKINTLIRLI